MSKELEALKQFRNNQYQGVNVYADELLDIIETALKEKEKQDKALGIINENSNYALMFVDGIYCLVDTKDNKFDVIGEYDLLKEIK